MNNYYNHPNLDPFEDYYVEDICPDTTASILTAMTEDEDYQVQKWIENSIPTITSNL